jgi:hypothetical protein
MNLNRMFTMAAIVMTATMATAHLPSADQARNHIGPMHESAPNIPSTVRASRAAPDVSTAIPFSEFQGAAGGTIVSQGTFDGSPLYWTNQWWAEKTDIPGEFADSGGTSPWGLINSKAFTEGKTYEWVGWNDDAGKWEVTKKEGTWEFTETQTGNWGSQIESKSSGVYVPTWRDGAEGAYTMIHDDIGAMSYDGSVEPANEVARNHPDIRVGWGMKVDVMDETEWAGARSMVEEGHEILNHSWDHSSAAEQWQWHYMGDTLSKDDPALPKEIRGLVVGTEWGSYAPMTVEVPYVDYIDSDPSKPDTVVHKVTFQVSSDYKADSTKDEWDEWQYFASGSIKPEHKGWSDDANANVAMIKVFCVPGWAEMQNRADVNIISAKDMIDEKLYSQVDSKYFQEGKRTEYYVYPYDAYSNKTHDMVLAEGHIAARGGAKSGMPLPGDFYQPFRIDFDAFFMLDANAETVFPDNPHQRLSLQGLVERVYKTKGYMIREFHACADVVNWYDANDQALGGWWGGIPKSLYETHFTYLDGLIEENKITVLTPTEAVKYRITANSVTGATVSGNEVTVSASGASSQYQDEISVIVILDEAVDKMAATYSDGTRPRYTPRKMDSQGKAWSISVNPYKDNGKITLEPNADHTGISELQTTPYGYTTVAPINNGIALSTTVSGTVNIKVMGLNGRVLVDINKVVNSGVNNIALPSLSQGVKVISITDGNKINMSTKVLF